MRSSNRIHDAFDSVKASEELKSLTKEYLRTARQQESRQKRKEEAWKPVYRRALVSFCAMLVLALGGTGYFLLGIPVSYVSIDVNPSIELALNRIDRVISADAYNEDGLIVLDTISVGGMYYMEAIEQLVESEAMQPYLLGNAGLTFTVASDSGQKENALLAGIENTSGCQKHGGQGFGADISTVQEAHECGLSLGKYTAYQVLSQYDSSVTAEDCHNMTMSEIHGLIEEHEHTEHNEGSGHNGSDGHNESSGYNGGDGHNESNGHGGSGYGSSAEQNMDGSYGEETGYGEGSGAYSEDGAYGSSDRYETGSDNEGYGEHGNGGHKTGHGHSHE